MSDMRYADSVHILDEKASSTVLRARRGSARGTSASQASAASEVTAAFGCEPVSSRGARCVSRLARRAVSWLPSSVSNPARAGSALAFEALHARTRPPSQTRGSGAGALVAMAHSGAPERDDPRDLGRPPISADRPVPVLRGVVPWSPAILVELVPSCASSSHRSAQDATLPSGAATTNATTHRRR